MELLTFRIFSNALCNIIVAKILTANFLKNNFFLKKYSYVVSWLEENQANLAKWEQISKLDIYLRNQQVG